MLTSLRRLLNCLTLRSGPRGRAARRERRATLTLEALEDRLCPAIDYWTGAGAAAHLAAPNDNWSNAQNWQSGLAPNPGDTLVFNAGVSSRVANNDYAANTLFTSIQIAADGYQLQGNAVRLSNGVSNSIGFNTIDFDITLTAAQTFTDSSGTLDLAGSLKNGGNLLTVAAGGDVLFTGSSISGTGGLAVQGNGYSGNVFLMDSTPDSYTGLTTVTNAGVLYLAGAEGGSVQKDIVAGDGPGPNQNDVVRIAGENEIAATSKVTVLADGLFDLDGFNAAIGAMTMSGGYVTTGSGTLTLNGNVTTQAAATTATIEGNLLLGPGRTTFTVASGSAGTDLNVKATISGSGVDLDKAGAGRMSLSTDNTFMGQIEVSAGTLVDASTDALGNAAVTIDSAGTLELATSATSKFNVFGNVSNAGALDFDGNGTDGTLAIQGSYRQSAAGSLQMALADTCSFDQMTISGTASLAGTLDVGLQDGFRPAGGDQFTIMTFASSSGAFSTVDLPNPGVTVLRVDPQDLTIVNTSSKAGSGPSSGPTVDVWTGAGGNANWTNPRNWATGVAPSAGDALYFPAGAPTVSHNDFAAGTVFASITLAGSGYDLTGNNVALLDGLSSAGVNTIDLPLTLASSESIDTAPGTTLTINGVISGPFSSNVSFGGGTIVLTAADTYEGYTTVTAGILALDNVNALSGAPVNGGRGTGVDAGATLQLVAAGTYALDPIDLNGAGFDGDGALDVLSGDATWLGPIKLDGNATITSAAGATFATRAAVHNEGYQLTVDAVGSVDLACVTGAGGLVKNGPGTLTFTGPSPNLYAGPTIINDGTVIVAKANAVSALGEGGVVIEACGALSGTGTIDGNVINDGVLSVGSAGSTGRLTINGNYTQTANGTLDLAIASAKAFDQLSVVDHASLAGTLNVRLLDGFQPLVGEVFPLLTFGSSSGQFGTINLPLLPNGMMLSDVYDPMDLSIVAALATING